MFSDDLRFEKDVTLIVVANELTSSVMSLPRFLFHKFPVFREHQQCQVSSVEFQCFKSSRGQVKAAAHLPIFCQPTKNLNLSASVR